MIYDAVIFTNVEYKSNLPLPSHAAPPLGWLDRRIRLSGCAPGFCSYQRAAILFRRGGCEERNGGGGVGSGVPCLTLQRHSTADTKYSRGYDRWRLRRYSPSYCNVLYMGSKKRILPCFGLIPILQSPTLRTAVAEGAMLEKVGRRMRSRATENSNSTNDSHPRRSVLL